MQSGMTAYPRWGGHNIIGPDLLMIRSSKKIKLALIDGFDVLAIPLISLPKEGDVLEGFG